jgi:hypothetical protein
LNEFSGIYTQATGAAEDRQNHYTAHSNMVNFLLTSKQNTCYCEQFAELAVLIFQIISVCLKA